MLAQWTVVLDDGTRPYAPDVAVDQRRPLAFAAGEDVTIDVSLVNPSGGVVILGTGEFLQLSVRTLSRPTTQLLTKRSAAAGQRQRLTIAADDTKMVPAQDLVFDLWAVRGSARTLLIPTSELRLGPSALGRNYL